jgi:IS1 family transposase
VPKKSSPRKSKPLYRKPPPKPEINGLRATPISSSHFQLREDGTVSAVCDRRNKAEERRSQSAATMPELVFHDASRRLWLALDADTKLIPSFIVGKRDAYHAKMFMDDLASRLAMRVQISSDSLAAYPDAFERSFGTEADYGQIVKTYSVTPLGNAAAPAAVRYSPAEVVKIEKTIVSGTPDVDLISTSHVEKQNHTLRMHCRRLTRLTNAFSKKFENFEAAVALNFAYYNFIKTHKAIRMTPAMAAGVEKSHWTVAELIERCGE